MPGWLISAAPGDEADQSTQWYASFWEFCSRYCEARFGAAWHLSPGQSLLLHAENAVLPAQVVVYSPEGSNNNLELPFDTSLYDLRESQLPLASELIVREDLRLFSVAVALARTPPAFFGRYPLECRVALASLRNLPELLGHLLNGQRTVVAGRLAGAFRRIGRVEAAEEIVSTIRTAGQAVRECDPFDEDQRTSPLPQTVAPIVGRLQTMWTTMREDVIAAFPEPPGLPNDRAAYLRFVDEIYRSDAYHSLSIEGYRVSPELVERAASGNWNPDANAADRASRDGLAAHGYWRAFGRVKRTIAEIVGGAEAATLVRPGHREWHRELCQPCVAAGLIAPAALAGYRRDAVYLLTSRYVPPRWETVGEAMEALFDLLESEDEPCVRAVLGHWLFGYIHPYPDGNGRMARFLMNAMLASGGYPWTVIRVEDWRRYLDALDRASLAQDIRPFARFIAECVQAAPNLPALSTGPQDNLESKPTG